MFQTIVSLCCTLVLLGFSFFSSDFSSYRNSEVYGEFLNSVIQVNSTFQCRCGSAATGTNQGGEQEKSRSTQILKRLCQIL